MKRLENLNAFDEDFDVILYDVLGDVVCGGFCVLLVGVLLVAYATARCLPVMGGGGSKRMLLAVGVCFLVGILAFFKYANFGIQTINDLMSVLGRDAELQTLNILLPIGLSFYTFMAIGYVLDVYWGKILPERNLVTFGAFMCFFPQLTAGPIGRGGVMLPQFSDARLFDRALATDGCRQILWGAFKKLVVADMSASVVNAAFASNGSAGIVPMWTGTLWYAVQVYADFSGYTDMAIGTGKLFGFRLARNFACPYFATNVADFWRRWHMSLTTWLRDYIYIPLGGSRCRKAKIVRNTIVVFAVSGLWHGANWTFVSWGVLHGLCLAMLVMGRGNGSLERASHCFPPLLKWAMTFLFVTLAWVFFRADSLQQAFACLAGLFSGSLGQFPSGALMVVPWMALMFGAEWLMRQREHPLDIRGPIVVRWSVYALLVFVVFAFHPRTAEFIYAQF